MGKLNGKMVTGIVMTIIVIIILFNAFATLVPEAQTAGNDLNASNRCEAVGCFYNASVESIAPCRNGSGDYNSTRCETSSAIPFGGLFSGGGIVFLIVMIFLFIMIFKNIKPSGK